jgi:hypothetical protein
LTKNNNLKYITLIYLKRSVNSLFMVYTLYRRREYHPGEDRCDHNYETSQLLTRYDTLSPYDSTHVTILFFLKKNNSKIS